MRGRPSILGEIKVSIRVLFSESDYAELQRIATEERTDIGSLVRRAVVRHFALSAKNKTSHK
jgi:hypothetical protein